MDPTSCFFGKLRNMAVTLERESASLQQAYKDNCDNTEDSARVLHELHTEVKGLKGQVQEQLVQQKTKELDVRRFINACKVMSQKFSNDIDRLRQHCEQYGYQAPSGSHNAPEVKASVEQGSVEEKEEEDDEEEGSAHAGDGEEAEEDLHPPATPPKRPAPSSPDLMRTPQFSDFGLSELHLMKVLGFAEQSADVAPMPVLNVPPGSLCTTMEPPMPKTPKCALRMDDDELLTPVLSEYTMCLNKEFTMNVQKTQSLAVELSGKPPQTLSMPPISSAMDSLATNADMLESPEPPVLYTPGFKLTRTQATAAPPSPEHSNPGTPGCPGNVEITPELPAFQTPYLKRLLSTKKDTGEQEATGTQKQDGDPIPERPSQSGQASALQRPWECDTEMLTDCDGEQRMPETPKLELFFGNSLFPSSMVGDTSTLSGCKPEVEDPSVPGLDVDGPTQEFNLGTPRIRGQYREPMTPEMPDLSSVTMDICKLVSQTQSKKPAVSTPPRPQGKENRGQVLSAVSEKEFLSLPSYLRQVSLTSLNQAIQKISRVASDQRYGEQAEFQVEELKRITGLGTKAPIYFLCLQELKKLDHIRGIGNSSVYRLLSKK